jgi:hypothetical protein
LIGTPPIYIVKVPLSSGAWLTRRLYVNLGVLPGFKIKAPNFVWNFSFSAESGLRRFMLTVQTNFTAVLDDKETEAPLWSKASALVHFTPYRE